MVENYYVHLPALIWGPRARHCFLFVLHLFGNNCRDEIKEKKKELVGAHRGRLKEG